MRQGLIITVRDQEIVLNSEDPSIPTNILLKYSQTKTMNTERAVLNLLALVLADGAAVERGDLQ